MRAQNTPLRRRRAATRVHTPRAYTHLECIWEDNVASCTEHARAQRGPGPAVDDPHKEPRYDAIKVTSLSPITTGRVSGNPGGAGDGHASVPNPARYLEGLGLGLPPVAQRKQYTKHGYYGLNQPCSTWRSSACASRPCRGSPHALPFHMCEPARACCLLCL